MPGGGIVGGSAILIGSELGIGKSTLMLQMMHDLAEKGLKILNVFHEELASQIKLRSNRIGAAAKNLFVLVEVSNVAFAPRWNHDFFILEYINMIYMF
jgi:DNA repair protein RadA/Sms